MVDSRAVHRCAACSLRVAQLLAKRVNFYRPLILVGLLALLRQDSPGFGRPSSSFSARSCCEGSRKTRLPRGSCYRHFAPDLKDSGGAPDGTVPGRNARRSERPDTCARFVAASPGSYAPRHRLAAFP